MWITPYGPQTEETKGCFERKCIVRRDMCNQIHDTNEDMTENSKAYFLVGSDTCTGLQL